MSSFADAAESLWKIEYARDLLAGLGYEWDIDGADGDELVLLAEQEGCEWDGAMWRTAAFNAAATRWRKRVAAGQEELPL